ncbi:MAG: TlpA disulfide reductase family protein [Thioalkalispiraceae bacterium]|jgi:peroxiredoxin
MQFGSFSSQGKTSVLLISAIAIIGLAAGIGAYTFFSNSSSQSQTTTIKAATMVGSKRPEFSLKDVDNKQHRIADWDGKVLIINFWATWCPPCRREIPAFIELEEKYREQGFSIVGVALDSRQAAIDYVDPMGINYPILVGDIDGIALSQQYGNKLGVLPYTVIIDRQGTIRHVFAREVHLDEVEKLITPLLSQK